LLVAALAYGGAGRLPGAVAPLQALAIFPALGLLARWTDSHAPGDEDEP
jgi:hypothetical protein